MCIAIGAAWCLLQPSPHSARKKVFVAEDAPDARAALAALFDVHGFDLAGTASTEYGATEWLGNNESQWDLAIVDLLLLDGSGFNVVQRFAHAPGGGKVVVFSAYVTDAIRARCLQLGADAVFLKTDIPKLVAYLESLRGT